MSSKSKNGILSWCSQRPLDIGWPLPVGRLSVWAGTLLILVMGTSPFSSGCWVQVASPTEQQQEQETEAQKDSEKPESESANAGGTSEDENLPFVVTPDFVYGHKDGMALTFDVLTPKTANGHAVCFMVSGGWNSKWFPPTAAAGDSLFRSLMESGYTLFFIRHGSAPKYKVPEAVDDVRLAISTIKRNAEQFKIDPETIGVCGGSAGGHLSLMLGTTGRKSQRAAAVVAYFPPTNLNGYVANPNSVRDFPALDFAKELADDVSPELQVTADDAPALLIHGDQDRLVPLKQSQNLKKAMEQAGVTCQLIVIEGAEHGFNGEDKVRAEKALIQWFDKYLRGKETDNP